MDHQILYIYSSFKVSEVQHEHQAWIDHRFIISFKDDVITLDLPDVVDYWKFVPLTPPRVNQV